MSSKVTHFDENKFTKGFNCGYILAKYSPELIAHFGRSTDSNDNYLNGILLGIEEFNKERILLKANKQLYKESREQDSRKKISDKAKRKKQLVIPDAWKKISIPQEYLNIRDKSSPVYRRWVDKKTIKMILSIDEKLFNDIITKGEIEHRPGPLPEGPLWNLREILKLLGFVLRYYEEGGQSAPNPFKDN